ncbi:hypothetical protein C4D60_Mb11t19210 [Musa balbisiana]|uniref:Uncharacterized protein n=1 Tax=Musa balbisiana TaxID=52838 RepID=A0A4S8J6V5_MUSBA|nr:hypothetical protein C4D60_Mb11t19210 [Musa balbisiana]
MTYRAQDVENIVVLDTKLGAGEVNGDYVRLGDGEPRRVAGVLPQCPYRRCNSVWWWIRVVLLCICLCAAAVPLIIFAGPLIIKKVVVPFLNWEMATFSRPVLGLLLFACIALFPTMILPSSPCMWIAGMTFGYGYGFLLIMAGSTVATNVEYGPYISGSLVGTIHETFITIYSGRLLQSLADATNTGGFLSLEQVIYDVIGFCIAAAATAAITIYAKTTLQTLQVEDELRNELIYYYHDYYFHFPSESLSAEFPFLMEETRESGDCFAQRLMS